MPVTPIQYDPALAEVQASGEAEDWIGVIGNLADQAKLPPECEIVTRFGSVATLRLQRGELATLQQSGACDVLEASRRLTMPGDDDAMQLMDKADTAPMRPDNLGETGAGTVVGVVDWGIDFAHPAFLDNQGNTRLIAIWDQRDRYEDAEQGRWGYGRIIGRDEINDALRHDDPYEALNYRPWDADSNASGSHGTHVASIAAGSAHDGGNAGVAPGAQLVFVHLANTPNILAGQSLGSAQSALEAIDFIFDTAGEKPTVINLSVGAHGGSHTGKSLVERGMDQAVWMQPGRAIVNSAGNYRRKDAHASGRLRTGQQHALTFVLPPDDRNNSEVEVFYPVSDRIHITLLSPEGEAAGAAGPNEETALTVDGKKIGHLYQRVDPASGDRHVDAFLYTNAPPGKWQVVLSAEQVDDGRFHAWIERDASQQPFFIGPDVDPRTTIGTLANGEFTITTGAYDRRHEDRPMGAFSSLGPTRSGRIKPEVIAPGVRIQAARSTPRGARPDARTTVKSGTSMAAPAVAGSVALMFEAAQRPLEIADTRALLFASLDPIRACSRPQCVQEDLHGSGYGALNISRLLERMRDWRTQMNEANPSTEQVAEVPLTEDCACDGLQPEASEFSNADLAGGTLHTEHYRDHARLVREYQTRRAARTGDLLVSRSPGEGIDYKGVILSPPGIDPRRAALAGMQVEDTGPGQYAEVLELDESGQGFRRVVRRLATPGGEAIPGRKVYPVTTASPLPEFDEATTHAESLPSLAAWQHLISFRPPVAVQRSLKRRMAPDWDVHRIEDARGEINLDYYPVRVTRLPFSGRLVLSPQNLLQMIRLDINRFIDTRISSFAPYNRRFAGMWRSSSPVGSVIHIDMKAAGGYLNPDDGSVVCASSSADQWIFSTIWTPADFGHPVSGNRQFGFRPVSGGFEFFTRGADRTTGRADSLLSSTVFGTADRLWLSLQRGITDFVNSHGGAAVATRRSSRRFNWSAVKSRYWRPTTPWV